MKQRQFCKLIHTVTQSGVKFVNILWGLIGCQIWENVFRTSPPARRPSCGKPPPLDGWIARQHNAMVIFPNTTARATRSKLKTFQRRRPCPSVRPPSSAALRWRFSRPLRARPRPPAAPSSLPFQFSPVSLNFQFGIAFQGPRVPEINRVSQADSSMTFQLKSTEMSYLFKEIKCTACGWERHTKYCANGRRWVR